MATFKSNPGDIFFIPAEKNGQIGYVLARNAGTSRSDLTLPVIEVFASFYSGPPPNKLHDPIEKTRMFNPFLMDIYFSTKYAGKKWRVIGHDGTLPELKLAQNDADTDGTWWQAHHVMVRVNAHMEGLLQRGDLYDDHKVTQVSKNPNADPKWGDSVLIEKFAELCERVKKISAALFELLEQSRARHSAKRVKSGD